MARTSPWPTVLGTAALIALPVLAAAQSGQASSAGSQQSQTPQAQSDTRLPVGSGAATQHLTEAKQVLDGIPRNAVTGRNAATLNEIRREFAALQRSYSANPSTTSNAKSSSARGSKTAAGHWNTQLMALDRDLTALLGASSDNSNTETSSTAATSGTETTGTSGSTTPTAGKASSASSLDPNVRSQLDEFRKHITEFAAAASGTEAGGEMTSADQATSTPSSATPTEPAATPQTGSSSSEPTPSSSSPAQTGSASGETAQVQSGQTAGTSTAQVDANAARQHLTEARQSLADLAAMPQAQQLQGEARTAVAQLISQFNQLITTQDEWRASYEQVNTTLTTLLNSSASSASTQGGSSSSTQGAVGTSGSPGASGTVTLDPAIRSKLEEFRTHLQAFYESAGGSATASSAPASEDAESHIAAIERILGQPTTGTESSSAASGSSVTLTQQQIDQIRMHLQQLRNTIKK